jgi:hypothetical protein
MIRASVAFTFPSPLTSPQFSGQNWLTLIPAEPDRTIKASVALTFPSSLTSPRIVVARKVAVTDMVASIVMMQAPDPLHAPLQPAKVEAVDADAFRVTMVFMLKSYEQVEPQLMPEGELVTVPEPLPAFKTVRTKEDTLVGVGVGVSVLVGVSVGVGVLLGVNVGELVGVGVLLGVKVGVLVGVDVLLGVNVGVSVGVGVLLGVNVGVLVAEGVFVGVYVGVLFAVTEKLDELVAVPPALVTLIGPVVAPAGTVALISVAD